MLNGLNAMSLESSTALLYDTIPDKTLPSIPLELDLSVHTVDSKLMLHMAATRSLTLNLNMMAASNGDGDVDAQFILLIDTGDEDVRIENNMEEGEALTVTFPVQSTTSHLHQGTIQFSMQTGGVS
jgi:hypothetical protein